METSHSKEFYQSKIEELNQKRDELEELILRYNDMRGKVRTSFGGDEARKMEDMIDDQINLLESTLKDSQETINRLRHIVESISSEQMSKMEGEEVVNQEKTPEKGDAAPAGEAEDASRS